jgi:hypothetical protein
MTDESRLLERQDPQVGRVRDALGAIAAANPAVFWLYMDGDGRWCVRREGAAEEVQFADRDAATDFAQIEAARCSSYRLFVLGDDGRIREDRFNWPGQKPDGGPAPVAVAVRAANGRGPGNGRSGNLSR